MRGFNQPPPGTVYFKAAIDPIDPNVIVVYPVQRDRSGQEISGKRVSEYSGQGAFARASERAELLNRMHREILLDNIRNTPSPGTPNGPIRTMKTAGQGPQLQQGLHP